MRFVIYGAGAIGSVIGGYLFRCGYETVLVCSEAHAKAVAERGLRITGITGRDIIQVPAVSSIERTELRHDDVIFFTMKSFDTRRAVESLAHDNPSRPVVCFQNGIRNEPIISVQFKKTYGGIVYFAAKYLAPGAVIHVSENSLGLGLYPEGLDEQAGTLISILKEAGFNAEGYDRIMAVKWSKLFFNLSNALFAVLGVSTREGFMDEKIRFMVADLLEEADHAARREGIEILPLSGRKSPEEMIAGMRKPGSRSYDLPEDEDMKIHSSTWQDLYLGRGRTEVEGLNGEIVRLGEKHGIETPLNRLMVDLINRMAREGRKPGYYNIHQLSAMLDS